MIKLIIFDLDGVLVDAKEIHYNALNTALKNIDKKYVIGRDEHLSIYDGNPTRTKLKLLSQNKGLPYELHDKVWEDKQNLTIQMINDLEEDKRLIKVLEQLEHRYERINFKGNIKFINDSKATNFHAVTNAINRSKNIILILHGLTKNIPSEELKLTSDVKKIIVQSEMKLNLNQFYGKIIKYESINEIKNLIKSEMQEGDTVLFSCGGASFNDFKNYKERGNFFKKLVNEIDSET